jgi:hypothetical protein
VDPVTAITNPAEPAPDGSVEVDLSRRSSAWDGFDDDSPLPPRRPKVFTPVTWTMVALLLTAGGFALGAKVGRDSAPAATASAPNLGGFGGFGARPNAAGGTGAGASTGVTTTVAGRAANAGATGQPAAAPTGAPAGGGGFGGGTFGTVKLIDGTNVYLQDNSGNVIKVTTTPEASITVSKKGTVADLKAGDTVVVQGAADADGNIAATAIVAGGLGAGGGRQRGTGGAAATNSNGQAGG